MEKNSRIIKNYAIWLKYDSRSGTHNMYREYRDLTLTGAVDQLCEFARHISLVGVSTLGMKGEGG